MHNPCAKLAIIIPARNEELFLGKTLSCIYKQNLQPQRIIVINDGSRDKTSKVALGFDRVEVIDLEDRGFSAQATPILAYVINQGLKKMKNCLNLDYIMIMGADHLLPPYYTSYIVDKMEQDKKIAVCSGQIEGERSILPWGSGRVVRADFWKKIGLQYPLNYGFETYLLLKAQMMGYKTEILDVQTYTQRKTGQTYKKENFVGIGKSLKALGYGRIYAIVRIGLIARKTPKGSIHVIRGYISKEVKPYDDDTRKYLSDMQHMRIRSHLNFFAETISKEQLKTSWLNYWERQPTK